MSLASQIESVQPDVYYKLLSEAVFEDVAIFQVREKSLKSEVNKALSGLAGRNGKGGATIEVLFPTLKSALPDTPGPICTLEQRLLIKEQRTVNRGANGTGLSAENLAVSAAQTLQLFFFGGPLQGFYAAPTWYREVESEPGEALFVVEVTLHATFALTALQRTLAPEASTTVSGGQTELTLTDQQPGGGSTIFYTTDGSFPGPGNPHAVQYARPFGVASGAMVRTAAYEGGLQGSMVDMFSIT